MHLPAATTPRKFRCRVRQAESLFVESDRHRVSPCESSCNRMPHKGTHAMQHSLQGAGYPTRSIASAAFAQSISA